MNTSEYLKELDARIQTWISGHTHACQKGCHFCCSEPLYVDRREVEYALQLLNEEQRSQVAEKTRAWLQQTESLRPEARPSAFDWRDLKAPCPFLHKGLCSVYDRRPGGCRVFFAQSNPENCEMPFRKTQLFAEFPPEIAAELQLNFFLDNPQAEVDHLGVWLAEILLGIKCPSGSRFPVGMFAQEVAEKLEKHEQLNRP